MKRLWKTALTLTICLVLCAVLMPGTVRAAEIVDSGACGDNLTWTLDSEGTLTISGTGEMYSWNSRFILDIPWYSQRDLIYRVNIQSSVTSIGEHAFYSCSSLTSMTIPDSVTTIGDDAFSECSSLTSVTIPDSVTSIGRYAFSYCGSLTNVTIPDSVTSIGNGVFSGCESLTHVTIPGSVSKISDAAFANCESLTDVTIQDGMTSIGVYAFGGTGLINITIPNSVTSIDESAFEWCYRLTRITLPANLESIGYKAFKSCSKLASITIPDSVTSIGGFAFSECYSLTFVILSKSLTEIDYSVFDLCTRLQCVFIPKSVVHICDFCFTNCSSISDVYYSGTPEEWAQIETGFFNDSLLSATIHYYSSGPIASIGPAEIIDVGDNAEARVPLNAPMSRNMTVYGARYSVGGRFLGLTSVTLSVGESDMLIVPFEDGSYLRVFATDAQTGAPLCDCLTVERPE